MPAKRPAVMEHIQYHKDGTLWAKGQTVNGVATGYWEWFRKDGTKLRSGYFMNGQQVGQWTTYDASGRAYKVTTMKAKQDPAREPRPGSGKSAKRSTTQGVKRSAARSTTRKPAREAGSPPAADPVQEYLAALPEDRRAALERLRTLIRRAVPKAEECFYYRLPAFRLDGRPLVAFGATAKHCSFYPLSGSVVATHQRELQAFDTTKGCIRFQPDQPLSATLVRKLVKYRIAENAGEA